LRISQTADDPDPAGADHHPPILIRDRNPSIHISRSTSPDPHLPIDLDPPLPIFILRTRGSRPL